MVSVKTEKPVPKDKIFEVIRLIRVKSTCAPVYIGDIITEDVFGTNIVAAKTLYRQCEKSALKKRVWIIPACPE